jgi:hypothetical protein
LLSFLLVRHNGALFSSAGKTGAVISSLQSPVMVISGRKKPGLNI